MASKVVNWKINFNLSQECLDEIAETFKNVLMSPNSAYKSYYETKKMNPSLGLPSHKIDVCKDNCMLYWKEDRELLRVGFARNTYMNQMLADRGRRYQRKGCFIFQLRNG